MKGAELCLKAAYKLGRENVFGIVGGESQAIQFDEEKNINFYLTRHEFAAGIMADVYSRITDKPQMCYSTAGPGLTNLSTGVFSAIQDRSPVLVVSAQIPKAEIFFNETHQCLDNVGFMKTITKYATEIDDVMKIPEILTTALNIAVNGIPGPVYISFPWDIMKIEVEETKAQEMLNNLQPIVKKLPPAPDYKKLDLIIEKIIAAKHPLILAGNQVIREESCSQLLKLVNATNIPVMSTICSKGVIPENHPLCLTSANKYIDKIYLQSLTGKVFADCDLLLLIGYDIGEDAKPSLWNANKIETIVVNSFYNDVSKVFQPSMLCLGGLSKSLEYLCNANIAPKIISDSAKVAKKSLDDKVIGDNGEAKFLESIMDSIRNALGEHGILCVDVGLHKLYAALFSKTYHPNTFISSGVCSTFGFGLPAGLGIKLAMPHERVCVVCGDGGFHSTSQDIETAIRYNIPIVIVLLNDNSFGMIKCCQFIARDDVFSQSVELGKVDFVKLANANGMDAKLITDALELENAINDAFKKNVSLLIEVPITYPYQLIAQTV
ncbi:MAG: thiamine pyrophosphate-dependent enzyme possible carboligase or decarboxylase [Burkholderiales bacterium]|nr:thiamine pyrophosphate-dependent enzyme possible carboligase or decarboxylase [Burkholderiales bacterium]